MEASPIKSVKIYGKKKGQTSVSWIDDLNLNSVNDETKKHSSIFELAKQGKYETLSKIWPVWFPYPSSWLREIILVPIAFPGTRLIVFGLVGVFISFIGNRPILLIFSILFGLLIVLLQSLQTRPKSYSVDRTDLEIDRLRGDMGLTQIKKGKKQHLLIKSLSQYHYQTPKNLKKKLLIIIFIPLVAIVIYLLATIPKMEEQSTTSIASQVTSPTPFSAALIPQTNTFRYAVNQAISAAKLTQSAKSPDEWKTVMSQWEAAIALMKTVPSSSPNYAIAQQKIIEYQKNINYAQKNSVGGK